MSVQTYVAEGGKTIFLNLTVRVRYSARIEKNSQNHRQVIGWGFPARLFQGEVIVEE